MSTLRYPGGLVAVVMLTFLNAPLHEGSQEPSGGPEGIRVRPRRAQFPKFGTVLFVFIVFFIIIISTVIFYGIMGISARFQIWKVSPPTNLPRSETFPNSWMLEVCV